MSAATTLSRAAFEQLKTLQVGYVIRQANTALPPIMTLRSQAAKLGIGLRFIDIPSLNWTVIVRWK